MRRRNTAAKSITLEDLIATIDEVGLTALSRKMKSTPSYAAKVHALINAALAKKAAEAAAAAEAEAARVAEAERAAAEERTRAAAAAGPLTDREGWTQLAALVTPSVLPDLTDEERAALRAAFLEEAAKAA